jgi:hypothetical protein
VLLIFLFCSPNPIPKGVTDRNRVQLSGGSDPDPPTFPRKRLDLFLAYSSILLPRRYHLPKKSIFFYTLKKSSFCSGPTQTRFFGFFPSRYKGGPTGPDCEREYLHESDSEGIPDSVQGRGSGLRIGSGVGGRV